MKSTILAVALMILLALPACAQIQSVHIVRFQGTDYTVTDVKSHTHTHKYWGKKILVLNTIMVGKDGEQIAGYPLTIREDAIPKADRKAIPDYRPLEQRRPLIGYTVKYGPNIILTAFSLGR